MPPTAATDINPATEDGAASLLRSTRAIRSRANALLARARRFESEFFTINDGALPNTAALVAEVTTARYPDLKIPYHSRWRHFEAGGHDRAALLNAALGTVSPQERATAQIDLALVSVLLDAGAGPSWRYEEANTQQTFTRSEGLGVASVHAFRSGLFSSDPARLLQADAKGLQAITAARLGDAFQVAPDNPLIGLEGRATLLRRLGDAVQAQPAVFGSPARPGGLFSHLAGNAKQIDAHDILTLLLTALAPIWPAQNMIGGQAMGDCWRHPAVQGEGLSHGWMPFHKLSQWLTYSLLEPFEWAGVKVAGLDGLTGLPEYRNGGLLLDAGVLRLKDESLARTPAQAGDAFIVEWRALTVALLDELAPLVRDHLGLTEAQMPLACVLEGGTWAAGRVLAQRLRGGSPPLNIVSDGTVF
ncbi:MAG: URC4/urg3 family protein [Bdellovibrionales bacterium]|nr:URC4/urg3 family protein [Ramlibacter sp.]